MRPASRQRKSRRSPKELVSQVAESARRVAGFGKFLDELQGKLMPVTLSCSSRGTLVSRCTLRAKRQTRPLPVGSSYFRTVQAGTQVAQPLRAGRPVVDATG